MFLSGDGCGGNRCADQHPAIAIKGLFFQMLTDERDFQVGDKICLGVKDLEMEGGRQISNARGSKGRVKTCGISEKTASLRGLRLMK